MKKFNYFCMLIMCAFTVLGFIACGGGDDDLSNSSESTSGTPSATFSEPSLTFGWQESSKQISVTIKGVSSPKYLYLYD